MNEQIYAVYGTSEDRNYLLGYATGNIEDIMAYFEGKKGYGLEINPVKPIKIQEGYAKQKAILVKEKVVLEAKLAELNKNLELK